MLELPLDTRFVLVEVLDVGRVYCSSRVVVTLEGFEYLSDPDTWRPVPVEVDLPLVLVDTLPVVDVPLLLVEVVVAPLLVVVDVPLSLVVVVVVPLFVVVDVPLLLVLVVVVPLLVVVDVVPLPLVVDTLSPVAEPTLLRSDVEEER